MDYPERKNIDKQRTNRGMENVDDEVERLFKKDGGKVSSSDFMRLKQKYNDVDLLDKIQKAYSEKYVMIDKKAKKFAQLIREKYSNKNYPFHILLEKARLFKVKHGLSENEFAEFQRIYEKELAGIKSPDIIVPNTNMMKVLGNMSLEFHGFNKSLSDDEYKVLQEILKLYASSKTLHSQVLLQSLQYRDCDLEAITGQYKRELGHRPVDSIHPVIAAMFLPKIDILDKYFLHTNIARIVHNCYKGEQPFSREDIELHMNLLKDPNDVVCDYQSPVTDLFNRAQIQNQLWNCVLSLRNGQYFNPSFREFISTIDMCKINRYDTPDLIYGRYDGTVLKRLLSAFSFRPTYVATTPVYQSVSLNPYQQNIRPMVTNVPMINLRLPPTMNDDSPIDLEDATEQYQYFLENGAMVPRHTSLIYSRGVLFFFVDRRANVIRYNEMQPFNILSLPTAVSGFERLNDREVTVKETLTVRGDVYKLRSVVLAEVNRNAPEKNIVVGSSTIFMIHADPTKGFNTNEYFHYDPLGVSQGGLAFNNAIQPIDPIYAIKGTRPYEPNFIDMAQKRGIV